MERLGLVSLQRRASGLRPRVRRVNRKTHVYARNLVATWNGRRNLVGERLDADGLSVVRALVNRVLDNVDDPVTSTWVSRTVQAASVLVGCVTTDGGTLTPDNLLAPRTVARAIYVHRSDLSTAVKARLHTDVATMATALGYPVAPRPPAAVPAPLPLVANAPLTRDEEAQVLAWSAAVGRYDRRHLVRSVLALTLGTGARLHDIRTMRGSWVHADTDGVHVSFRPQDGLDRTVTCRAAWEDVLLAAARDAGDLLLAYPKARTGTKSGGFVGVATLNTWVTWQTPPVYLSVTRLRLTWVHRHLETGTPLPVFLPAAGFADSQSLRKILPTVPAVDGPRRLRDAR